MQVQAINTSNYQPKFGAFYQPKDVPFNKIQKTIAGMIMKAMREPLPKFKGNTAEGFYESKGVDFEIAPKSSETVSLSACRKMQETGIGVDRGYTYSCGTYIGEYDQNSKFRVSDIEVAFKDEFINLDLPIIVFGLALIVTILLWAISWSTIIPKPPKQKILETTKPLIEKVDSVANRTKTILPILEDSFKLWEKVIRK